MPKADTFTVQKRLLQVIKERNLGKSTKDIISFCKEKWGLKAQQAHKYISKIDKMLIERVKVDMTQALAEHVSKRDFMYERAIAKGDDRLALEVDKDAARLKGLYIEKTMIEKHEVVDANIRVEFIVNGRSSTINKEPETPLNANAPRTGDQERDNDQRAVKQKLGKYMQQEADRLIEDGMKHDSE